MKKTLKTLLSAILVLAMVLSFAACSKDKAKEEPKPEEPTTTKVTDVPAGGEVDPGEDNSKKDEKAIKKLLEDFSETLITDVAESMGAAELVSEEAGLPEDVAAEIMDNILESITVDIGDITVDGDAAEAELILSSPDFENIDFENADMETLLMEYLENEGIDLEELSAMSEDEQLEYQTDAIVYVLTTLIEDAEIIETTETVELEKVDDEWTIVE